MKIINLNESESTENLTEASLKDIINKGKSNFKHNVSYIANKASEKVSKIKQAVKSKKEQNPTKENGIKNKKEPQQEKVSRDTVQYYIQQLVGSGGLPLDWIAGESNDEYYVDEEFRYYIDEPNDVPLDIPVRGWYDLIANYIGLTEQDFRTFSFGDISIIIRDQLWSHCTDLSDLWDSAQDGGFVYPVNDDDEDDQGDDYDDYDTWDDEEFSITDEGQVDSDDTLELEAIRPTKRRHPINEEWKFAEDELGEETDVSWEVVPDSFRACTNLGNRIPGTSFDFDFSRKSSWGDCVVSATYSDGYGDHDEIYIFPELDDQDYFFEEYDLWQEEFQWYVQEHDLPGFVQEALDSFDEDGYLIDAEERYNQSLPVTDLDIADEESDFDLE